MIEEKLDIELDRDSSQSLYLQIVEKIRESISNGQLQPGVKLPSSRAVAARLGVHRKTVMQAFALLESDGWVETGVGQGTFVGARVRADGPSGPVEDHHPEHEAGSRTGPGQDRSDCFGWDERLGGSSDPAADLWRFWLRNRAPEDCIRLTGATADPAFFPAEEFREVMDGVLRDHGATALDYGPPEGHLPLREWVAGRLGERGVEVHPEQVLIVSGSQQGMDLISRLLLEPGETVVVEEPGYSNGFRLFQAHGARVVGVPIDPGGLEVEGFRSVCRQTDPRLLYLMPIYQNPTGSVLEEERMEPILDTCAEHGVPILEDHFDADLAYDGEPPAPLKARDRRDQVILLGTFSKILFPGLRLGWLILPRPLLEPMREVKQVTDLSTGLLVQYAMDLFCRRGLLDRHLEKVRGVNRRRLEVTIDAMRQELPEGTTWTSPRGGMTLWVRLPGGLDSLDLLQQARRERVDFSPGPLFFPNGGGSEFLRLTFIRESEERMREGIRILGSLIRENLARVDRSPSSSPFL